MSPIAARVGAVLAAAAVGLAACGNIGSPDAAATVNGEGIPRSVVEGRFDSVAANPQFAAQLETDDGAFAARVTAQILTELIEATLVRQGAGELGVDVGDDDLAEQRAGLAEQLGGEDVLDQEIERQGLSEEDVDAVLRELAYREAVTTRLLDDTEITDADVETAFEERRGEFEVAEARHILVESEDDAEEVIERLEDGEDFADVAEDVSIDQGTAVEGGELGEIARGEMVPEFEEAVFDDAEVGEVHGPVESDFGFHIIEVLERDVADLADVEGQIRDELATAEETDAFQAWLDEQRAEADIRVNPVFGSWDDDAGQVVPDFVGEGAAS